jgi:predicted transcriptional regulator
MSEISSLTVLSRIVDRYDEDGKPVTPEEIAESVQTDPNAVKHCFEELEENLLLAPVDHGFRPTVTARDLLELDIDDGKLVIVDTDPEDCDD